jgi:hypothetical protein
VEDDQATSLKKTILKAVKRKIEDRGEERTDGPSPFVQIFPLEWGEGYGPHVSLPEMRKKRKPVHEKISCILFFSVHFAVAFFSAILWRMVR